MKIGILEKLSFGFIGWGVEQICGAPSNLLSYIGGRIGGFNCLEWSTYISNNATLFDLLAGIGRSGGFGHGIGIFMFSPCLARRGVVCTA